VPYAPATELSYYRDVPLPIIADCPEYPAPLFVSSLADTWNCNKGCDKSYFQLYKRGDIIPLQIALPDQKNTNVQIPTVGWRTTDLVNTNWYIKAELFTELDCVTPVFTLVEQFCKDWWVTYSDRFGSLQTLFIDTSLLPINQNWFRLKITTVDAAGIEKITIWSELFKEVTCEPTVLLESSYNSVDCLKRHYGAPRFVFDTTVHIAVANGGNPPNYQALAFYNSLRFNGSIDLEDMGAEQKLNDLNRVLSQKEIDNFLIRIGDLLPPYAAILLNNLVRGTSVFIDNVEYVNFGNITRNLESGRMFLPKITCQQICNINNISCTT
jgi:hypothetical protein